MSQPLVIAYHLIWTAYGWWLPNDPRGSGSDEVRKDELDDLGPIHFGRKSEQPSRDELRAFHREASEHLDFPTFWFDEQTRAVITRWQAARGYPSSGFLNKLQHKALLTEIVATTSTASSDDSEEKKPARRAQRSSGGGGGGGGHRGGDPGAFVGGMVGGMMGGMVRR